MVAPHAMPPLQSSLPRARSRPPRAGRTAWVLRAAAAALALAACEAEPAPRPPNVVLVTLDTTRADYLSSYGHAEGHPGAATPSFDALAADGVLFELALATAAVTPVSHASILTGMDPPGHGLRVLSAAGGYRLPEDVPTLATLLRQAGWSTAAVHSAFPVSAHFGLERGFDVFESFEVEIERTPERHRWDVERFQRRSDETTDLALEVLRDLPEPFFLWIHYWDPHDAKRLPPEEFLARQPADEDGWSQHSRLRYAAEVRWLDAQFGRLIGQLRQRGLYDDTLFAVTADHGEGLGEHDWQGHRLLYQEQIHVPLILRLPGAPAGLRVPQLVRTTDVLPTVLDYLSLATPRRLDGRSLRPLIEGAPDEPRIAYADQINGYDLNANILHRRPDEDFLYAVTDGRWKLIYYPNRPERSLLFDLAADPDEEHGLWDQEPEQRVRLLRELASRAPFVTAPFPPETSDDEGARAAASAALEDLGYAGGDEGPAPEAHWVWTCAQHESVRLEQAGRCARCGDPLILRSR